MFEYVNSIALTDVGCTIHDTYTLYFSYSSHQSYLSRVGGQGSDISLRKSVRSDTHLKLYPEVREHSSNP